MLGSRDPRRRPTCRLQESLNTFGITPKAQCREVLDNAMEQTAALYLFPAQSLWIHPGA